MPVMPQTWLKTWCWAKLFPALAFMGLQFCQGWETIKYSHSCKIIIVTSVIGEGRGTPRACSRGFERDGEVWAAFPEELTGAKMWKMICHHLGRREGEWGAGRRQQGHAPGGGGECGWSLERKRQRKEWDGAIWGTGWHSLRGQAVSFASIFWAVEATQGLWYFGISL